MCLNSQLQICQIIEDFCSETLRFVSRRLENALSSGNDPLFEGFYPTNIRDDRVLITGTENLYIFYWHPYAMVRLHNIFRLVIYLDTTTTKPSIYYTYFVQYYFQTL